MSRKRWGESVTEKKEWQAALYMRLSREDERQGESASIENQRKLLLRYCGEHGFHPSAEYVDDGCSGTDMEGRPALRKMLSDIKDKKINLVLVKDLSRLGRNIGDTSTLLDKFFPQHRVRFISVTDGTDTARRDRAARILTPLYNFTNELYAADISDKIHAALQVKMENGEFIGSFPPYGYKKAPEDKNRLVPDGEAAGVVQEIFQAAAEGKRPGEIAGELNERQISTPSAYRAVKYPASAGSFPQTAVWSGGMVGKILRNQVYLGHMVQGKTEKPSFKCKTTHALPQSEWKVVENTHLPLVTAEMWEQVRRNMQRRRAEEKSGFQNAFSGMAFCADCGRHMSTAFSHGKAYLVCGGYKAGGRTKCGSHRTEYDALWKTAQETVCELVGRPEDIHSCIRKMEVEEKREGVQNVRIYPNPDVSAHGCIIRKIVI